MELSSIIRRYGATEDCFAFELGKNEEYGQGIIALKSNKYNSKVIYEHLRECCQTNFYQLLIKIQQTKQKDKPKPNTIREINEIEASNTKIIVTDTPRQNAEKINRDAGTNTDFLNTENRDEGGNKNRKIVVEIPGTQDALENGNFQRNRYVSGFYYYLNPTEDKQTNTSIQGSGQNTRTRTEYSSYNIRTGNQNNINPVKTALAALTTMTIEAERNHNTEIKIEREVSFDYKGRADPNFPGQRGLAPLSSSEDDETDESFYQDKYIPQYVSRKHMISPPLEYIIDEENSIYGRVKL